MRYKALMLDLDGTTVPIGSTQLPSEKVRIAIEKAAHKVFVGVATGRPLFFARSILDALPFTAPCIVNGGAQIYDPIHKSILWEKKLPNEEIEKFYIIARGYNVSMTLSDGLRDHLITDGFRLQDPFSGAIEDIDDEIADKIIARSTPLSHLVVHKVPSPFPDKTSLEINHVLATKQHGIYEVARRLGVHTDEVIGVGDSGNDLPLLMACGLKVAVQNAVPSLRAIADYVAPSVTDDGVADVIEKFILKPNA
jgi:HAD superfamily hydrolase (TIGR01484 family)